MRVFAFAREAFGGAPAWAVVAAAVICLAAAFAAEVRTKRKGIFASAALFSGCACFFAAFFSENFSDADTAAFGILLGAATGLFSLLLQIVGGVQDARRARRERNVEAGRRAVYTFPDRENTFVRDRLNTSLRQEEPAEEGEYGMEDGKLRLEHVRKMLQKLKTADLTPGDRLEADGISRRITLYATKDLLSGKEVRDLNDCLANVLKMTAKYAL